MIDEGQKYDFAIVGGGAYGLSAAYFLSKTEAKIAIFDQYTIGHANGSSHGPSRILRSTYGFELFRDLNKMGLQKHWPEVEKVLESKFIYNNDFLFYDDQKQTYEKFERVAKSSNGKLIFSTPQEIVQKYEDVPLIKSKFPPIIDESAGMIASDDFVVRMGQYLKTQPNIAIFENTLVKNVRSNEKEVCIETEGENLRVDKVLLACGRWINQLVPEMSKITTVAQQFVGYFQMKNPEKYQFGRFPSIFHRDESTIFYAIPDRKNQGLKIGQRIIDDRSYLNDLQIRRERLKKKAKEWFGDKVVKLNKIDICYYTLTKTEEFIIDWADPGDDRILVCSCCSGHGFKFVPIIGDIISDLLTKNKSIQLFEKYRHTFQIPYHMGINLK